ncbi:MAG: TorF family putative porin [Gemmatimonadota bacterium]|nr:TorF family putative porin [Gemmatimonadota bacterium]
MKPTSTVALLAFVLLFGAPSLEAQEMQDSPAGWLSGSISLMTDYSLRGISQTLREPALQGSIDLAHPSGLYFGAWASSVNFGEGDLVDVGPRAQMELDIYGGFALGVGSLALDAGAVYYAYPGAAADRSYNFYELSLAASHPVGPAGLGVSALYSPDFFAQSGSALYVAGTLEFPLSHVTLSASLGRQTIELNDVFGTPDYLDYGVGAAVTWEAITVGLRLVGTELEESACFGGTTYCGTRVVMDVSRAL